MSEQPISPDRQQEHLARLQHFINQPDGKIIAAGFKKAIEDRGGGGLFFDVDKPGGEESYQRTKAAFEAEGRYQVAEVDFSVGGKDKLGVMREVARSVGMPDERIVQSEDWGKMTTDVKVFLSERENPKPVAFFWKRPDRLGIDGQAILRSFHQTYESEQQDRFMGLFSNKEIGRQIEEWTVSPLFNVFGSLAEKVGGLTFDPERGRETIAAYRRAINDLSKVGVGRVVLPSGTGKSSFARLLGEATGGATHLFDLEFYLDKDGRSVETSRLPQKTHDRSIPIFDEAQALTKDQKLELIKQHGKVLFVENKDFVKG
jgi:hypothetical protein